MSFSEQVWQKNLKLYNDTLNMPYNQELANGTLAKESFQHYIIQDAHYLEAYGRCLAVIAAKADNAEEVILFCDQARFVVIEERKLHNSIFAKHDISAEQVAATPLSAACHHYTEFLLSTAWAQPYAVALASVLACGWVYAEIGRDILKIAAPNNPYQEWIDTYAAEDFHLPVQQMLATIDRVAANQSAPTLEKMHAAYTYAAKLEWIFWQSAYERKSWPI